MNLLVRWIVNTLALFVVVTLLSPHLHSRSIVSLAIAAAVLGLLNAILRPVLVVLTLPLTIVTLGVFLIVLNALMLELTAWLVPGFHIQSFSWAFVAAIVLAVISLITNRIGRRDEGD
jgi:putative membrane protein